MEIVHLGTLYFDGKPSGPEKLLSYMGPTTVKSTVRGNALQWVRLKSGILLATRNLIVNVSWNQLNHYQLVFGKHIVIDGKPYLLRCPTVGEEEIGPNEWDTAMNEAGESEVVWHWGPVWSWGQETAAGKADLKVTRGWKSARSRRNFVSTAGGNFVGYRPVLEEMPESGLNPKLFEGMRVKVYADNWDVTGKVIDCTDYDLVLSSDSVAHNMCGQPKRLSEITHVAGKSEVIINRNDIAWIEEPRTPSGQPERRRKFWK